MPKTIVVTGTATGMGRANEPRLIAFHECLSEDHMRLVASSGRSYTETREGSTNIRIYGTPSDAILEMLSQAAGSVVPHDSSARASRRVHPMTRRRSGRGAYRHQPEKNPLMTFSLVGCRAARWGATPTLAKSTGIGCALAGRSAARGAALTPNGIFRNLLDAFRCLPPRAGGDNHER
jgi:hypothetical protein